MANIVTKDDFIGLYFLDTDDSNIVIHLDNCIEQIEAKYLSEISYNELSTEESADVKTMLVCFIYFRFTQDQETRNSTVGSVQLNADSHLIDNRKIISIYNDGVSIYNDYTIVEEKEYINSFGV